MLSRLIAEGFLALGETASSIEEAKKKPMNPKRKALIAKLRKVPGVRDPEALASWIANRVGGLRSHS